MGHFSADFFSSGQELLYGGGIYDEKFSRGHLMSKENRVFFFSLAEMLLLFVTVISGEKCMLFYSFFFYEKESNYNTYAIFLSSETICSLSNLLILSL
jgi:hypothetical protein